MFQPQAQYAHGGGQQYDQPAMEMQTGYAR
jgi:hypothetical protein